MIKLTSECDASNMGCLELKDRGACFKRPPTLIKPSLSTNGFKDRSELLALNCLLLVSAVSSSGNNSP